MFNTSAAEPHDDIGLVAALNVTPRDVLGAVFGAPPEVFPQTIVAGVADFWGCIRHQNGKTVWAVLKTHRAPKQADDGN
jgi:hypothetical protein